MRRSISAILKLPVVFTLCITTVSYAAESKPVTTELRAAITKLLHAPQVLDIRPTQLDGLYEVALPNRRIIYVHPNKKLVFAGQIYDADKGVSLTAQRAGEVSAMVSAEILKKIDKSKAVKLGNGPVELIEFTDVDCGHCRQSEQYFKDKDAVFTRYIFLLPGEKNVLKTKAILGSDNAAGEYLKTMSGLYDKDEPPARPEGESRAADHLLHVKQALEGNQINGTPTFLWPGGMVEGLDANFFDKLIDLNAKGKKK